MSRGRAAQARQRVGSPTYERLSARSCEGHWQPGYLSRYIDARYIDEVDPVVLASARRHGVADQDMLHAYRNPVRVFEFDDLTMLIGADAAGRVLEIGMATAEGTEFIVHAMPAREKFLR